MQASHVRLLIVVMLVIFVSVATADRRVVLLATASSPGSEAAAAAALVTAGTADAAADAAEVARVRVHLLSVENELLSADVRHLTLAQREHRAHNIDLLREYRLRGIFPHNHARLGRRVPVFIDEHGTHCAVGYLLATSGHEDLARRIAADRNYAHVEQLADLPELVDWLDDAGLSLEEAGRIQPTYEGRPPTAAKTTGHVATAEQ